MDKRTFSLLAAFTALSLSSQCTICFAEAKVNDAKIAMAYQVSGPFSAGNLSVFLIHGKDKAKGQHYLTLPEGLKSKQVVVHETGDVNCLKIDNLSDSVLFIQAGEIVKGGQQDRALQSDLLIPPHTRGVNLSCFCVENGRWEGRAGESVSNFNSANNFVVGNSLLSSIKKEKDQSQVWQQVAETQTRLSHSVRASVASPKSPTSLQLTVEDKNVKAATESQFKTLSTVAEGKADAIGYAVVINGNMKGGDIYASQELFKKLWPGLLKSAVIEAVAEGKPATNSPIPKPITPTQVRNSLVLAQNAKQTRMRPDDPTAPTLQGATNGTIAPIGTDTFVDAATGIAGSAVYCTTDKRSGVQVHVNVLGK